MTTKKRANTIIFVMLFALSLLLAACGKGGANTPAPDSSPVGVSDAATTTPGLTESPSNTPGTPEPTETDRSAGSRYDFTKLSQFTPEIKIPSTDISKYFSANETEFDIVQCARDLGFYVSLTAEAPYSYGETNASSKINLLENRARFPLYFFYKGTWDDHRIQGLAEYYSIELDSKEWIFTFQEDGATPENEMSYFVYHLEGEDYSAEKTIKLLGRPEDDKNWDGYRDVYVNRAIINLWVWFIEKISKAPNPDAFCTEMKNEIIYKEIMQKYELVGLDFTQRFGLLEYDIGRDVGTYGRIRYDIGQKLGLFDCTFKPSIDLSKYYNGNGEFNLIQCASDLGYDTSRTINYIANTNNYCMLHITYPRSDGQKWGVEYSRWQMDTGKIRHGLQVYPIPKDKDFPYNEMYENPQFYFMEMNFTNGAVKITGMKEEPGAGDCFLSKDDIDCFVWFLEDVKSLDSEEATYETRDQFDSIFMTYIYDDKDYARRIYWYDPNKNPYK